MQEITWFLLLQVKKLCVGGDCLENKSCRIKKSWQHKTPAAALLPSEPTTECSQGAPASTARLQCFTLACTTVGLYKIWPFVHNPACDEAFVCRLHPESSVTWQTLLGLEDASKNKPQWVSPMFKGMEDWSMHFIEWLHSNKMPWSYLMVPTKMEISCPDSLWQFGLMSLSPNAHRCFVGFRSSHSQRLFL